MFRPGRRRFLLATVGLGASLGWTGWQYAFLSGRDSQGRQVFRRTSHALGTKISIVVMHENAEEANSALDAGFAAIEQVEATMSIYRVESQLSQLNRTGMLRNPHPSLVKVLQAALATSETSRGAFDVTVQPLWEVFAAAQRQQRLPSAEEIVKAKALVGWKRVNVADDYIQLSGTGTKLTLNGIAQGFAADQALAALQSHGVKHALIDTGELAALGERGIGDSWRVGVQHPREPDAYVALAKLQDRCLSTSGDYATTFSADRQFNHVFDPVTGLSPQEVASVSVAAPTAMQADAWSTSCFVLGPARASELLQTMEGVDALFVLKDGRMLSTKGFPLTEEGVAS